MEKGRIIEQKFDDRANSFLYVDCPQNTMAWDVNEPTSGYVIMVDAKLIQRVAKDYNFVHYNNHEALYLTKEEEVLLWDLFKKAYDEFQRPHHSKDVIVSYITLILSYTQIYYNRQFDTRSAVYHQVVDDFYKNLREYYDKERRSFRYAFCGVLCPESQSIPQLLWGFDQALYRGVSDRTYPEFCAETGKGEVKKYLVIYFRDIL